MADLHIERADISSVYALKLIDALNAELTVRYPEPGANHFRLKADEVAPGRGAFLLAHVDDQYVGCGAIRRLDESTAELKRMYVEPSMRGLGIGRALVAALEDVAHELDVKRIVLETGVRQPEAIGLYKRAGFTTVPAFGEYVGSLLSVCMAKELVDRAPAA